MSSSKSRLRLLLDTTYLLPIVGIDVEGVEKPLMILEKLYERGEVVLYFTPFNILELVGKLSRMSYDRKRVELGLRSIRESFRVTYPTVMGYMKALELRRKGFRDLVDLLLYATSRSRKLVFLTRDRELVEFLKEVGESVDNVIYEEKFVETYGKHVA